MKLIFALILVCVGLFSGCANEECHQTFYNKLQELNRPLTQCEEKIAKCFYGCYTLMGPPGIFCYSDRLTKQDNCIIYCTGQACIQELYDMKY